MAETLSLLGLEDFHGEMGLDVRVAGTFDQPLVDAGLQGKNISFENIHVPELDAGLRFEGGRLFLDQCSLSSDNSRLEISGIIHVLDHRTLKPVKDPTFDLKLAGAKLFIEDFVADLKGKLAINGHIKGSISHPDGYVTLEGEDIDLGVQKISNVHLSSRLDGGKVHIDPLVIAVAPGEETRIEGRLSPGRHYDLKMVSKGISLKHFGMLQGQGVGDEKIAFSLSGKGNFGDPALKGDVVLSGVRLNNKATEDFLFQVDVQDQTARIQGDLNFELKGNLHLQTKAFSVSARFDQTDPAPYAMFLGWDDLNGVVTGKIEAIGNISAPDQVSIQADMTRLDLFYKGKELLTTKRFKASFKNGEVSIPGIHLVILKQGFVDIKGRGSLGGQLKFEAEGSVSLHGVLTFMDALPDISGELDFSAALEGSLAEPDFKAEIKLKRVGLIVPGSMQHVREGEGSIHVTSRNIILKDIHGMLDSGQFDLNGKIDLEQFQPSLIEIQVNAHELPLNVPDILEMRIDADLVIRGTPEESMIVGKAVLLEGKYYQDVKLNLIESMGKKRRKEPLPRFEEAPPILKNMGFDIALKHKAPFIVENNLALLKVRPDLHLYGEVTRPLLSGRAEVESGIITFERKEFEIRKGVFDFVNPYRIEPDIDVQSEIVVRDWTIFLDVSGRPDNLEFKLSSDPPEDNRDILSLLVFGQTSREMDEASSGLSASPTQMIADMATLTLQESLKSATGLDMVELEYKEQEDADGSDEIKITVGKRLSRKLAVTYGMETKKGEVVHRVTTEHKILEKLIINAFDDSEGVFGGEILFRLEFR